jgi:hypothetical protein
MNAYVVILARYFKGSCIGSTRDVVQADTAADAERALIDAWKRVRPECTFRPLLTIEQRPSG